MQSMTFLVTAWKGSVSGVFLVRTFPYSVWMRENTDQKNSEYRRFSGSVLLVQVGIGILNRGIYVICIYKIQ